MIWNRRSLSVGVTAALLLTGCSLGGDEAESSELVPRPSGAEFEAEHEGPAELEMEPPQTDAAAAPSSPSDDVEQRVSLLVRGTVTVNRTETGGAIPVNFLGLSLEWTLLPRYMDTPTKRARLVKQLTNLGRGSLRIGGMSQEVCDGSHADYVTPNSTTTHLSYLRDTLIGTAEAGETWTTLLGLPAVKYGSCDSSAKAQAIADRIATVFSDDIDLLTGVEIGNEFGSSVTNGEVAQISSAIRSAHPDIETTSFGHHTFSGRWQEWQNGTADTSSSSFHFDLWPNWPGLFQQAATSASLPFLTDHYYQLVSNHYVNGYPYGEDKPCNTCPPSPTWRADVYSRLLDIEHMRDTAYQLYRKGQYATSFGKKLRMAETNSIAGRGADGISNRMVSAVWGLHYLFTVACPFDPAVGASSNPTCTSQYIGVNFHNAETDVINGPGNAAYNVIAADGRALPMYYAFLLFGNFAQGHWGLRRVHETPHYVVFRTNDTFSTNVFVINKSKIAHARITVETPTHSKAKFIRLWNEDGLRGDYRTMKLGGRQVSAETGEFPWVFTPLPAGQSWTITVAPGQVGMLQMY